MLFATKAVGTFHAALERTEKVFNGIGGLAVFADIEAALIGAMLYGLMGGKLLANLRIKAAFIGMQF